MTNPQAQTTVETLRWRSERLELIDQRVLPAQIECVACDSAASVAQAIRDMVVRGAPAIGCAAAYGVALEALRHRDAGVEPFRAAMAQAFEVLAASRPTLSRSRAAGSCRRASWAARCGTR
jgi:methylthioribose-1-phosphate isomerase